MIRGAFLMAVFVTARAQTLEVMPAAVDRGAANIFRILLKPRAEQPIAALQWDLVYQEGLRIEPSGVVSGSAAETAEKLLTCAARPAQGVSRRLTCILAGGVQPLTAGAIAIVRFEAPASTPAGKMNVELERVTGVSPSLDRVAVEGTRTTIVIR
jgi:hypothetical protein